MTDGEDIGEDAAPETIMDAALTSGPPPKKNQPPTILPIVELQQDDVLAKGKGAQGDVFSSSILEEYFPRVAVLNPHTVDLVFRRVASLAAQDGSYRELQHQPKDIEYTVKIKDFIKKHEEFSLDEVLSKEMDPVFLRQLLEDILDSQESSLDAEKGGISPDPRLLPWLQHHHAIVVETLVNCLHEFHISGRKNISKLIRSVDCR